MENQKRKYVGRVVALMFAAPFVVFTALLTLLYLPQVQHWAVERAARVASDATGMDIRVERIRLAFPLDLALRGVVAMDSLRGDTLASVGELRAGVALWPLLRGEVEVDGIGLTDMVAHTGHLIPTVEIDGRIGQLRLRRGEVDLTREEVEVRSLSLQGADVSIVLRPDTVSQDSSSVPAQWKIRVGKAELEQVDFRLQIPADTLTLMAGWERAEVVGAHVDLAASAYGATHFALANGRISYDTNTQMPRMGFDLGHIAASKVDAELDSIFYQGKEVRGHVRQLALRERSGLWLKHTEGTLRMDSVGIRLPDLLAQTVSSRLQAAIDLPWNALKKSGKERLDVEIEGQVSPTDVSLFYPMAVAYKSPLELRVALRGNTERLLLDTLQLHQDSVARVNASGEVRHLMDDGRRTGQVAWQAVAYDVNSLLPLFVADSSSIQIPRGVALKGTLGAEKTRYEARLSLHERDGWLRARAHYDIRSEEYALRLRTDSLALHRFLPKDSLGHLTARVEAMGRGTDLYAKATHLTADVRVDSLQYGVQLVSDVALLASLEEHRAQLTLESRNPALEMQARAEGLLHRDSLKAEAVVEVMESNIQALQLTEVPLAVAMQVDMRSDSLYAHVETGDLDVTMNGAASLGSLINQTDLFLQCLQAQEWLERGADIGQMKHQLPDMNMTLTAGRENPVANYLYHTNGFSMESAMVDIRTSPLNGVSVDGDILSFRTDSLEFDTVKVDVTMKDDTTLVATLGVSNAPGKRKPVFAANLTTLLSNREGNTLIHFRNGKKELGLELGARVVWEEEGIRLSFFPDHPVIGFRTFTLNDSNYIALSDSGRVTANVTLLDRAGTGLRLYSSPNEEALQDITADLTHLNLAEILTVLPYAPDIAGRLNSELHYVKDTENNTFSGTVQVDSLAYDGYPLGTLGLEAVYLPTMVGQHLVDLQLMRNGEEIVTAGGQYASSTTGGGGKNDDRLDATLSLHRLPLEMANAFVPRDVVTMTGLVEGELTVDGSVSAPRIDGEVRFDSVRLHSPLYAVDLHTDQASVIIGENRVQFDDFPLYAKGKNPFTLTGNVNLKDFSHMTADLQMRAVEYELLNAKKNKHSVLHGKVFVTLNSTIKGELTNPVVRGSMNVLGNTDVTYVLKESALTVEDRLGSMVTFVNFNDSTDVPKVNEEVSLGGIDVLLNVQIDQGAEVQVDLGNDNYVEVQGGGNLSMRYTPQGDFLLTGRYTLNSGEMKYSLPVIPLKTFNIANGSYVEFTGNPANPLLNITATERMRTSVTEDNSSRYVNFDVGVSITNTLDNMGIAFLLDAPEDVTVQNQLAAMSDEERGKLAVTMLVTGIYAGGQGRNGGGFNTGNALNSFLQSEITNIAGSALKTVDVSIGVEDNYAADGTTPGGTDYSFRFAKRFWNNRLSVIVGGRISTGNEAVAEGEGSSFIDDISLEWRLDDSGTRYVRLFHTRNYESILEGEIIETGVGLVLRRKVNKLGELFIFRRKE